MKQKKAPGIDEITAEVLIAGGEPMIKMLHAIFTKVERDTISPKDWSKTLVNPVHKKGNKSDPENYRAISLISIPSKVFLRILLKRMTERCNIHRSTNTRESSGEKRQNPPPLHRF